MCISHHCLNGSVLAEGHGHGERYAAAQSPWQCPSRCLVGCHTPLAPSPGGSTAPGMLCPPSQLWGLLHRAEPQDLREIGCCWSPMAASSAPGMLSAKFYQPKLHQPKASLGKLLPLTAGSICPGEAT